MGKIKEYTKLIFKSLINPKNKLSLIPNWLSFTRAIGGVAMPIMAYSGASPAALLKCCQQRFIFFSVVDEQVIYKDSTSKLCSLQIYLNLMLNI